MRINLEDCQGEGAECYIHGDACDLLWKTTLRIYRLSGGHPKNWPLESAEFRESYVGIARQAIEAIQGSE